MYFILPQKWAVLIRLNKGPGDQGCSKYKTESNGLCGFLVSTSTCAPITQLGLWEDTREHTWCVFTHWGVCRCHCIIPELKWITIQGQQDSSNMKRIFCPCPSSRTWVDCVASELPFFSSSLQPPQSPSKWWASLLNLRHAAQTPHITSHGHQRKGILFM